MALSANATDVIRAKSKVSIEVVNAAEVYAGGYAGINSYTHGTSASRGRAVPANDANFIIPMGHHTRRRTGNTSATPIPEAEINIAGSIRTVAVTGTTGLLDAGRIVYLTDDATYTITRPSLAIPIGQVMVWKTGTTCDVLFFAAETIQAISLAGNGRQTWFLGVVAGDLATGNMLTGIVAPFHALIDAVYGVVIEPITDADATGSINLEIGGTDVTGGVITWATADVRGDKKAGTAITAANEMHEGDLIDVECTVGTAGTAADGYMGIYASLLLLPGF